MYRYTENVSPPLTVAGTGAVHIHVNLSVPDGPDANVAVKHPGKKRSVKTAGSKVTADAFSIVRDPDIDVVVELIGGTGMAKELILKAIND